jgi:ubiquinone biosynthesis protein COQ9
MRAWFNDRMRAMAARKKTDEAQKAAVLTAALSHAAEDGFSERTLTRAATDAGVGAEMMLHLFPDGPASLVACYSEQTDAEMEKRLAARKLADMKIRERIAAAVLTRLAILKPHKDAARRAAAFLMMPANAALAITLVYRTVDAMWRAVGDTSTDFNFYTKRAILAGVYSTTLMRWFTDSTDDESETHAFLDARIANVMQFEKVKAEVRERTKEWPFVGDFISGITARRS